MKAQRRAKRMKYNRSDSKSSFASMYSKSQRTGISEGSASGLGSANGDSDADADDKEDAEDKSLASDAMASDPVMMAFATLFDSIKEGLTTSAEQKLYAIEIQ